MIERVKQWSHFVLFGVLGAAFLLVGARVQAQAPAEHISVTLTDPSRPATVKTGSSGGKIIVKGSDAKEITVDARLRSSEHEGGNSGGSSEANSNSADGLKRIAIPTATGLYAQEENNVVTIGTQMYQQQSVDLTIGVPYKTSLVLQALGEIVVSDVEGNLEITNYANGYGYNGTTSHPPGITLNNVGGSVVASTQSGKILVTFTHVDPQKAISFSNYYGSIDVTFRPDLKADLILNSGSGNVYSDFDFQISQTAQQVVEDHRKEGGGYTVKVDKKIHGTIGGGGPEIQLTNLQGNIYIRKAKK